MLANDELLERERAVFGSRLGTNHLQQRTAASEYELRCQRVTSAIYSLENTAGVAGNACLGDEET